MKKSFDKDTIVQDGILEERTVTESDLLFRSHKYLLYRAVEHELHEYFDRSSGLRELWKDLVDHHHQENPVIKLKTRNMTELKRAEYDLDVALIAYYARNHFLVNSYERLLSEDRRKMVNRVYRKAKILSERR
jgi:hypothetical protein